jgi:membrane protein implicated in regulation of membrane protease activity
MAAHWLWWIVGVALIGAELITGTFYLLAIGIALLFAGLAAWLGADLAIQCLVAALFAVAGCVAAHHWRVRRGEPPPQPPLDVGQSVQVQTWHADGSARVVYRGTHWDATLARPGDPREAIMVIVGMRGSTLLIAPPPIVPSPQEPSSC